MRVVMRRPDGTRAAAHGEYTVIATGYPPVASSLRLDGEHAQHDVELGYRTAGS